MISYRHIDSPLGRLLLRTDGHALTGLYMDVPSHPPRGIEHWSEDPNAGPLPAAVEQLGEYFSGRRRDFDLPLRLQGTEFQQRVWQALKEIPYGVTWSYGQLATRIGNPNASRAVGLANGCNPVSILVPCHLRDRRERLFDRLWRRPCAQALVARARGVTAANAARVLEPGTRQ